MDTQNTNDKDNKRVGISKYPKVGLTTFEFRKYQENRNENIVAERYNLLFPGKEKRPVIRFVCRFFSNAFDTLGRFSRYQGWHLRY